MNWPRGNWTHSFSFLGISLIVSGVVSQVNDWERKPWTFGGYPSSGSWTRWGHIWFLTYHLGDLIAPPRVVSTENKPNLAKHPLGCLMCRSHSNKSVAINFVKRNGRLIVLPHASKNKIKQTKEQKTLSWYIYTIPQIFSCILIPFNVWGSRVPVSSIDT